MCWERVRGSGPGGRITERDITQRLVAKNADGKMTVKQAADEGPLGTAVGMLVGAMVGLIGGPAG